MRPLRVLLDGLGVDPALIPVDPQAQASLYRSLLAGRRVLVVLDNARDAGQVRPLLPGTAACLVVVTSRSQLPGLVAAEGARPLPLGLLPAAEARELLSRHLGSDRAAAEPQAVAELIGLRAVQAYCCGCSHTVAARAAVQPGMLPPCGAGSPAAGCPRAAGRAGGRGPGHQHAGCAVVVGVVTWTRPPRRCSACLAPIPARTSPRPRRPAWPCRPSGTPARPWAR